MPDGLWCRFFSLVDFLGGLQKCGRRYTLETFGDKQKWNSGVRTKTYKNVFSEKTELGNVFFGNFWGSCWTLLEAFGAPVEDFRGFVATCLKCF